MTPTLLELVQKLERAVTLALIAIICLIVVLATAEVAFLTVLDLASPPVFLPGVDKLLDLFGRILLVAIGLELVQTMHSFAAEGVVRVEIVLTVAITAVARSVIVMEPAHATNAADYGTAALLVALSLAYLAFVRRHTNAGADRR